MQKYMYIHIHTLTYIYIYIYIYTASLCTVGNKKVHDHISHTMSNVIPLNIQSGPEA